MDNVTHSLLGAALSEVTLPVSPTRTQRRVFLATGIVAANLPDLDLLYTGLTPPPLGYLLHHRGHTHTIVGLLAQGLLVVVLGQLAPATRRLAGSDRARLLILIAASLASHLSMDAWNSYGIHPFHPMDRRWTYGDAIFIFEPWLWLILGVAAAWNASSRLGRIPVVAVIALLPPALASVGVISGGALTALAIAGISLAWALRRFSPRARAASALAASGVLVAGRIGLSRVARAETAALLEPRVRGEIIDIVLSPNPAAPLCWAVIAIEKDEPGGELVLYRGTLSLLPALQPPTTCASHRLARPGQMRSTVEGRMEWNDEIHQPLAILRDLSQRDCWVRAWLQFGRAPVVRQGRIFDLRFENAPRENFTAMTLRREGEAVGCPSNVTSWAMPRGDLLEPGTPGRQGTP